MSDDYSKGYNGNLNIPAAGAKHRFTQTEIEEYIKCKQDPVYFAEKYFKVIHVDKGMIDLVMYDFQKEAARAYLTNRKMAICTSRQIGKTTVATVIILHFVLFNEGKLVALLANKGDSAREILERIQLAYENLPRFLQVGVKEWNKGKVTFENESRIIATASSSSAIRGKSASLVYIDETAFVPRWDEFSASVLPTLSSGETTRLIFTSTPNGLNHFYYYCKGAKEGKNGYWYIEVPWWKIPGRNEKWKNEVLESINWDMDKFEVEYCCRFSGSSGTLISGSYLQQMKPETPLKRVEGFSQFEKPEEGVQYMMTCDVSRGRGLDYSAAQIIKLEKNKFVQVAVYNNNTVSPIDFAGVIFNLGKLYNSCPILIELNDLGAQVADLLYHEHDYEDMIFTKGAGRNGVKISSGGEGSKLGITVTTSVKATGCAMLKLLVEQDRLVIRDKDTIHQLNVFSKNGNTYKAEEGQHDDLVMPLVIFAWMTADKTFIEITDSNILLDLRENTEEEIYNDLTPFGYIVTGQEQDFEILIVGDTDHWSLIS